LYLLITMKFGQRRTLQPVHVGEIGDRQVQWETKFVEWDAKFEGKVWN